MNKQEVIIKKFQSLNLDYDKIKELSKIDISFNTIKKEVKN